MTRQIQPVSRGAARRIPTPGTPLAKHGIVAEAKMARILAVVRLTLRGELKGNCMHEPNVLGGFAGVNVLRAEVGSNPRDTIQETEKKPGMSVKDCSSLLHEADWNVFESPSRLYATH